MLLLENGISYNWQVIIAKTEYAMFEVVRIAGGFLVSK